MRRSADEDEASASSEQPLDAAEAFANEQEAALIRFAHFDNLGDACDKEVGGKGDTCEHVDDRFFDSSDYRCCFRVFHAKIGAFAFCTWIIQEVLLASFFLLAQKEFKEGDPSTNSIMLLVCRGIQIPTIAIAFLALYRYKQKWLLPFIVVQFTAGIFADISTLLIFVSYLEQNGYRFLFDEHWKWLNIVLPLFAYVAIIVWLAWVMYRCYQFIGARVEHDERRKLEKERQQQMEEELMQHCGINVDEIGELDSNGENVNAIFEHRSASPSPPPSLKHGIPLQRMVRSPSNQIEGSIVGAASMNVTPHFHVFQRPERTVKQWHHTGSLQQLQQLGRKPSSARRLLSLTGNAPPLRRLAHEQSEPTLMLLQQRPKF
uniref:Transmembrane protein n=2 Tax=Bursaphelenchus xylophilus TaxID=6326 RepID=A0A1I7RIY3_BURXY